ncbi:MAG: translation elongation factor Ts [Candidatus Gracilibacteria bacterium]|nr:translation elongation factor Ts [Candidatus Gracilibacteria bacterium]
MSDISAKTVMELRAKTGVSMMACKKALVEAEGDEEKAIEILRKRGEAKSADKADRATGEGAVAIKIEGTKGCVSSLSCETDFVARNDAFVALAQTICDNYFAEGDTAQEKNENLVKEAVNTLGENIKLGSYEMVESGVLGGYVHSNGKIGVIVGADGTEEGKLKDVAMHAAAMNPKVTSPAEVTDELVAKEKEIWTEQLKNEGKPENIMEGILAGKEKKFREEGALLTQAFVKDPSMKVGEYLGGENVKYVRLAV